MALNDVELASTYLMRRLAAARQAQKLTASMQFDLARSPISDEELDEVVDQFRDSPRPKDGWGLSGVLHEVLSTEPKRIPVTDLQALQKNLIGQGYAPPDAIANGVWDSSWYAHLRRFDRDNFEEQRAGNHWYSAPIYSGTKALTNTLPSRVFQGIVGAAKGMVTQTPETVGRVGALGGAAAGAVIGTVLPGAGTLLGAGIGAGVGFIADLFMDDEGEEGQSLPANLIDALTPWTEYAGNPKAAWEDLGYVLTAASLVSGAAAVGRGVTGGLAGIRAGQASVAAGAEYAPVTNAMIGARTGQLGNTAARTVGAELVQPGSWLKAAAMPTKLASQTELGAFGSIARHVTKTSLFRAGSQAKTIDWLAKYSPIAFANRLGPKIALDVFGGVSQAAMGGRLFGGIGQGTKTKLLDAHEALKAELGRDLTEDEVANLERTVAQSTIEKSIANAPRLESGVEIPLLGDVVDLAAFMLYPQKLLPFNAAKTGKAFNEVLKADHLKRAFIHSIMDESRMAAKADLTGQTKALTFGQARVKANELSPLKVTWHMQQFGIHAEAHSRIAAQYGGRAERQLERGILAKTKADIVREITAEAEASAHGRATPTLSRVMAYAQADDILFEKWLKELNMQGRGLSRFEDVEEANAMAFDLQRDIIKNKAIVVRGDDDLPKFVWATDPQRVRQAKNVPNLDVATVQSRISTLEKRIAQADRYSKRGANSPTKSLLAAEVARNQRIELASLQQRLAEMKRANAGTTIGDIRLAPERIDTLDKQELLAKRAEFTQLRNDVLNAPTPGELEIASKKLENFARQLEMDGIINERLVAGALGTKPAKAIEAVLTRQAQGAASRFELPPEIEKKFTALGYKLVETGEDMIFPRQLEGMTELVGLGDYSRRANFWESLGLSTTKDTNWSVSKLRDTHIRAELTDALRENDITLSAHAANNRLFNYLDARNHQGAVFGPLRVPKEGKVGLYGTNIRDLSVEDIRLAFDGVPGFTEKAARDVFGALRRGSAYGGETSMLHPMDSFRTLAHGMRLQGAPAIADLMRTMHAEVPMRLNRKAWRQGEVRYTPTAELAASPQRARVELGVNEVALRSQANITDGQKNFAMALMDSTVEAQVKAGRFASVDEAYGLIDVSYAERYLDDAHQALFKRVEAQPSFQDLRIAAKAYEDTKDWYERSSKAIAELPLYGKHTLPGGKTISDHELFVNVLAATSPRVSVERDVDLAWQAFKAIKNDSDSWPTGTVSSVRNMLDDIAAGRTIDTWGPPRAGGREVHRRPKVWNFYQNLTGDLDKVTNDTWITRLFGYEDGLTTSQYQGITDEITRVADDLGWRPAHVQAALWQHARNEATGSMRIQAVLAEEAGDLAQARKLRASAAKIDIAHIGQYTDEIFAELKDVNPYALMQQVEDEVMGMTQFGPDFSTFMKFFRTGDFTTLVHENAHMLRQLLPDEDLAQLERAYKVRPTGKTPHGPGDDLRSIADEYHQQSGIKMDRRALEEYADVDEARAMRIADAYEAAKTTPKNRATKKAYKAFMEETMAQYRLLVSKGYKMVPWAEGDAPYKGAAEFIKDARENKRNFYFKTGDDQIPADHPLAQYSGVTVMDSAGNAYPQKYNDIFRTVHDLFGHAKEGVETGARGEENAWRQHARMYSPEARKAMTTETRGQNSWVNYGKHLRQEGGRVAKKGEPGFVRPQDRPYADQKAMLLPDEFTEVDTPFSWPREAEERFAQDAEKYILTKTKLADAPPAMGVLKQALSSLWPATREHALNTNLVPRASRAVMDKHFGQALSLVPETRRSRLVGDIASKQTAAGAVVGAGAGAIEDDEDRLGGALHGAAVGAGIGLGTRAALKHTYGYLPDQLQKMNTALRYTLSFTFDAGRISEQNMIAAMKFNLPMMMSPTKYTKGRKWRSPFRGGEVTGEQAWGDAVKLYDEINGGGTFAQNIDDLDRRMYQAGLLGFSPRNWEIAQTFQLWQRGMPAEEIQEAVAQIGRYGTKQTPIERTANFVVFPFSFSKKLLTTLGDFVLQQPGRNLMLHEGLRRYQASENDEKVREFLDKHVPLLEELKGINNLVFGLSPGRFFLAGLDDHRSGTGKAAQLLSSFLVPSGAATTLAQAAGNSADLAINAFVPLVITDESINRAGGIKNMFDVMRRYVPFVRELDQYLAGVDSPSALGRQITAATEGEDPYYQFSAYQDGKRVAKAQFEPLATAMGYSSVDGLEQSEFGQTIKSSLEAREQELIRDYPTGFRMSQEFTNQDNLDAQALLDLSRKENRSSGEDHILEVVQNINTQRQMFEQVDIDPQISQMIVASSIRKFAAKYAGDARFAELWDRFFTREFGPLRRVA